jgi:hypothetical protein
MVVNEQDFFSEVGTYLYHPYWYFRCGLRQSFVRARQDFWQYQTDLGH